MLIARAPFRISLAGGGTDLPSYYNDYGGLVISAAIDKYFYVIISPHDDDEAVQISSADYQLLLRHGGLRPFDPLEDLRHARAILDHLDVQTGYSIFLASQAPPGTGLGSSSAMAVAITKAITTARNQHLTKAELAETACHVEIDILEMPIGRQDQYAAAFGGLNAIHFGPDGIRVEPVQIDLVTLRALFSRLLLFFTGLSHDSSKILRRQTAGNQNGHNLNYLHEIKRIAMKMRLALESSDLPAIGALIAESWELKKSLATGISTDAIDAAYSAAREAGAAGGKITGAGGGGFLLLYCEPEHQAEVTRVLEEQKLVPFNFDIDSGGTRVLVNHGD